MFNIGDRVVVVAAQPPEGDYENGDKGTVVNLSYQDQWVDVKIDGSDSIYSTMYFSEVQKDTSLNTKDETSPSFQVGDRVKFTESSLASGMVDATEDDVFEVGMLCGEHHIRLVDMESNWDINHFEHVKEEIVSNTEEQEIKWEDGQEVWDTSFGQGVVIHVFDTQIQVKFGNSQSWKIVWYTPEGIYQTLQCAKNRTLFFSEPKIEAEKYPPKKPFTPKLKEGESVVVKHKRLEDKAILTVEREEEDAVWFKEEDVGYYKTAWNFFKIGEEVEFK